MNNKRLLVLGDILAIAILTVIGFATHGEADASYLPRMGTTFFPVALAWFLIAPWFGLFEEPVVTKRRNLGRVALAVLFAAPLAAVLRSALLNDEVLPVFALILGGSHALGMVLWRWGFVLFAQRIRK
ncbi:MAG: DUF3054 domain-containing protein [Anaerolineales bacterium]|nr:DUF3054 domain-containing protein [Anaerolineales bacterium]